MCIQGHTRIKKEVSGQMSVSSNQRCSLFEDIMAFQQQNSTIEEQRCVIGFLAEPNHQKLLYCSNIEFWSRKVVMGSHVNWMKHTTACFSPLSFAGICTVYMRILRFFTTLSQSNTFNFQSTWWVRLFVPYPLYLLSLIPGI